MKILHVIAGAKHGGAETFCLDTIVALAERGMLQHVICRPHDYFIENLRKNRVPFTIMHFNSLDRVWHGRNLIRKAEQSFQPDIVHAWMGRAASFIPGNMNTPVIGWFGGYYDLKRYRRCNFYIGITPDVVRHIIESSGTADRVFLVSTFGTLKMEPPVSRSSLDTPPDVPVVLTLSRMHPKKGIDTLLAAAARLPGVYFWLAGDGPEMSNYQALAEQYGLQDRVRFLGWRHDRSALLGAADICALPSRYEPFGTVMAEAWFMKIPLVAARAAGPSQYMRDGINGLLHDIDDDKKLAEAITRILNDKSLCQKITEGGSNAYSEHFSRDTVLNALIKTYKNVELHTESHLQFGLRFAN